MTMNIHSKHNFYSTSLFQNVCFRYLRGSVLYSERTYTLLGPPRDLTLTIPPGLPLSGGFSLPSGLKIFLDVRQLRNCYRYILAACMQLFLQIKKKVVCSQAPLLFSSHSINLIKYVVSP